MCRHIYERPSKTGGAVYTKWRPDNILVFFFFQSRRITCASRGSQTVASRCLSATCPASASWLSERRGAKPRLRQRTRSIPQTAGVFVCPRDVMVCEPSQDDRGRSLPRVIEVVRAALRASAVVSDVVDPLRRPRTLPREKHGPGWPRVASATGATPSVPARLRIANYGATKSARAKVTAPCVVCSGHPGERRGTSRSRKRVP